MSSLSPFAPHRCYQFTYADGSVRRVGFGASIVDARGYVAGTDLDSGTTEYPLALSRCTEICDIAGQPGSPLAAHSAVTADPLPALEELAAA